MVQLAEMTKWFGRGPTAVLGVLAAVVVLGTPDAKASGVEATVAAGTSQQVAMLGEPVRDSDLKESRGAGLDAAAPDASVQPSDGLAVILWDEPGNGKTGGGTAAMTSNTSVNVSVSGN